MTFLFTFSTLIFAFSFTQYAIHNTKYEVRKITYEIINLFLQNEPKFRKNQMNVTDLLTRNYDQMDTWSIGKNEPKTNPNEPKTNPIKANIMPIQTQYKPNLSRRSLWRSWNKANACPPSVWWVKGKKMCLDASKILTITNMDANFKKYVVFRLFIERTLFGR